MLREATRDRSERAERAAARLLTIESQLERWRMRPPRAPAELSRVISTLRDPEAFYDPEALVAAHAILDDQLQLFSLPFFPSQVSWNFFIHPTTPLNLEPMLEFCDDRELNPFIRRFEDQIDGIMASDAGFFAVSIASFSQVLPGLTLARMIRRARGGASGPHVSVGGNFFSRLRHALEELPVFFEEVADSVTIGEGEVPVVALADALERGAGLAEVPSLVYSNNGRIHSNAEAPQTPMAELAFQDLAGFPLDRYLSPEPVVCLRTSKGCYWGQCTFCDSHYGLRRDQLEVERVVAEMRYLNDTYAVRHFELVDQCVEPDRMLAFSDAILAAGLDVRWFCNGRTEAGFTPEILSRAQQAGATMVMWGVESASPRLLKLMRKGVSTSSRMKLLEDATSAGLWNFAYLFFGFPTETDEEADQTIDLVCDNIDLIHSYGRSVFSLGKHCPLIQDPSEVGIVSVVEDDEELSTNLSYELEAGLAGESLTRAGERCMTRCRQAYGDPLWMALRSRESLHLYLAERGREFVQSYEFEAVVGDDEGERFVF